MGASHVDVTPNGRLQVGLVVAETELGKEVEARAGGSTVEVFSREVAEGKTAVSHEADIMIVAGLCKVGVEDSIHETEGVLDRNGHRQVLLARQAAKLRDTPRCLVAQPEIAHFAGPYEVAKNFELLLDGSRVPLSGGVVVRFAELGHVAIRPVDLIEVNVIGLEALKAQIGGFRNVLAVDPLLSVAFTNPGHAIGGPGDLRGDNELVSFVFREPLSEALLCPSLSFGSVWHGIDLGGIDEVDAAGYCVVELLARVVDAVLLAPGHGAKTDFRNLKIAGAKLTVSHASIHNEITVPSPRLEWPEFASGVHPLLLSGRTLAVTRYKGHQSIRKPYFAVAFACRRALRGKDPPTSGC